MENTATLYPGLRRIWRSGFVILTIVIIGLFVSELILYSFVYLAFLQGVWWLASPTAFFNFILLVCITTLIGAWHSMIVVFGSTHPRHPKYSEWVINGLLVATFIASCWGHFIMYWHWVNMTPPPDFMMLNSFTMNSFSFTLVGVFVAIQSVLVWRKWLNPKIHS